MSENSAIEFRYAIRSANLLGISRDEYVERRTRGGKKKAGRIIGNRTWDEFPRGALTSTASQETK